MNGSSGSINVEANISNTIPPYFFHLGRGCGSSVENCLSSLFFINTWTTKTIVRVKMHPCISSST